MKRKLLLLSLKLEQFFKEQFWQLAFVIICICFFAWLLHKPFEAVMFVIAHLALRPQFYKQYHSAFISVCLFITINIAFFGIMFCLPVHISLLSAIPLAFAVCWIGDLAQTKIELMLENSKLKEYNTRLQTQLNILIKPKVFNVNTCTESELIKRCKALHFSKLNEDLAIEFFILKTKHKYIADYLKTDTKSVTTRKKRMKLLLNKKDLD